jgi:hypothetical protein
LQQSRNRWPCRIAAFPGGFERPGIAQWRGARKQVIFVAAQSASGERISQKNPTFSKANSALSLRYTLVHLRTKEVGNSVPEHA